MDNQEKLLEYLDPAIAGNKEALSHLVQQATGPLQSYVFRVLLRDDLTQDIVQEVMMEMVRGLDRLEDPDKFWPWLRGIANNKIKRFYRNETKHRNLIMAKSNNVQECGPGSEGLKKLARQEMEEVVVSAMASLKPHYRMVLSMRCFEQMNYAQIASQMDSSEVGTRMLFSRAKKALVKQLARNGLSKSSLLSALIIFGKLTAPSEAAAAQFAVSAHTIQTGFWVSLATWFTGKAAIWLISLTALIGGGGSILMSSLDGKLFVESSNSSGKDLANTQSLFSNDFWYYFPEEVDGPVLLQQSYKGQASEVIESRIIQNDRGNYCYNLKEHKVTIHNYHVWNSDLSVFRLPTDSENLLAGLSAVERERFHAASFSDRGRGLLISGKRDGRNDQFNLVPVYHYNMGSEEYFRYPFPADVPVVDQRDNIHRQGYCGFEITGTWADREVRGAGQMPFVYGAMGEIRPRLIMLIGNTIHIEDTDQAAFLGGSENVSFPAGSFFNYLSRPWMGLHVMDTIRRDAASDGITFKTTYDRLKSQSQVSLTAGGKKMVYEISMDKDWIDSISLFRQRDGKWNPEGELHFSYTFECDAVELLAISLPLRQVDAYREGPGNWLMSLAEDEL